MYIKNFIIVGIIFLLCSCIGENPTDKTSATTPEPTVATPTTPKAATSTGTTNADGSPVQFNLASTSHPTLRTKYFEFAKNNTSLDSRNQEIAAFNIATFITQLDPWSETSLWKNQHDATISIPPTGAHVTIKHNSGGSAAKIDAAYTLEQLTLEDACGLYIPDKGELLSTRIVMNTNSWVIVPIGRMGGQSLEMEESAILDIIGGNGFILDKELKDLKIEEGTPKGILKINAAGSANLYKSFISANKIEQQGDIKVFETTFNLQPVQTGNFTNIEYLHQKGKIHPLEREKPTFFFKVNGLYKLQSDATIEMLVYPESPYLPPIELKNLRGATTPTPTPTPTPDEQPSIAGKILFSPKGNLTASSDIVVINSDIQFNQTTIQNVSRLIHEASKKIGGKNLSLKLSNDNKQILLDITTASPLLRASVPIEHTVHTLRRGELKRELWSTSNPFLSFGTIAETAIFVAQSQTSQEYTSVNTESFGFRHNVNVGFGTVSATQTFNHAYVQDYVHRFIANNDRPFWIMQHGIHLEQNLTFGAFTLIPSAGLCHLMIPDTVFQNGFHTFHPELSVKGSIQHTVESAVLSLNVMARALYNKGTTTLSSEDWMVDMGLNARLQTSSFNISAGILNPLNTSAEFYLSFQSSF